jgi:hypothetical protein
MECEYNPKDLAVIVGHVCWKNYEVSKKVGKVILTYLNKITMKALNTSLEVVQIYLTLQDEY